MSATLSPTKAQILQSSQAGWSPLRIQKRSPSPTKLSPIPGSPQPAHADPASAPAAAAAAPPAAVNRDGSRRTSSSFSHLRQHSLVSNSPFKSPDAAHAPSGARYKPRPQSAYGYVLKPSDPARDGNERGKLGRAGKVPSGLGISGAGLSPMLNEGPSPDPPAVAATQRKSSAQRRQSEPENEDPRLPPAPALSLSPGASAKAAAFKPRKSRGLQELTHAHYVSRSPFLPDGDPASPRRLAEDGMGRSASLGSLMEENLDLRRGEEEEEGPPVPRKEHPVLPTPESELGLQLHEELPQPQRSAATTVLATATATATATTTTTTTATTTAQTVQFQLEKASPTPSPAQHAKHHPSLNASPRRPALTSYRLHGPRTNSSGPLGPGQRRVSSNSSRRRRRRNKKVTFDERCDVVEFEREESAAEEDEEGEWTEGTEGTEGEGSDLEGTGTGANSEAEVDGVLREEEWEEEEEGRLRVVNADEADEHEHEGEGEEHEGLHGLVSQLVASPAPGAAASPAQLPHPQYAQHDPSHLAPHGHPSGPGFAPHPRPRETSIDRIERDVESILRDADLLMPAGELAQDSEEAEADRSAVSQGTVEIHGSPRFAPAEHSFIHSQSMAAPPDLSTITPDTPGIPFSPDTSYASGAPSTPPRKSAGDYHNHTPATPSTPPNRSPLPRELAEDAEDGVPLGRTHHAARHGEAYRPLHAGLLPTPVLPDMAPNSPFVFSPSIAQGTPAQPHSPRITREEVRARLALSRFGTPRTRARQGTPTSPGTGTGAAKAGSGTPDPSASVSPAPTSTTAHSSQSTPVPNMFARGGPESPVPVEHAAPHGAREVEVFHPSSSSSSGQGTPGRMDKALPAPPGSGEGRPELKSAEGGSVLGVRSGLERLVEGVRQHASPAAVVGTASPAGSPSPGKTRRVPVPSFAVDSGSPTKRLATEEEAEMERTDSIEQREREVVAMRRERRERGRGFGLGEDEEESVDSPKRLEPPQRRTGRRRSLSMGDVEEDPKAEERELETKQSMLLPTPEIAGDVFSDSVEREVRKYIDGPRSYQIREHEVKVFSSPADREKVSHVQGAGDVDSGRAWKVIRRSSDMNEYAREIRALRKSDSKGKALGKVFVRVMGIKGLNVPLPRQPTFCTVTLNNGIHAVTTPEAQLEKNALIEQEFELIEHPKLEFTLTLKVRKDEHVMAQLRPPMPISLPSRETVTTIKSSTPTHRSGFRAFFGSPKKAKAQPVRNSPTPMTRAQSEIPTVKQEDCLARHLGPDGTLAQATISFKDIARRCDTRLFETSYPLMARSSSSAPDTVTGASVPVGSPRAVGEIILQLFRLPPLPGIEQDALPENLEECRRGLRHVAWHKALHHEGVLTQNGGDCSTWRRRRFRVVGAEMVASNDVTKKITATIDLSKAVSLEDDQDPALKPAPGITRSMGSDDDLYSYTGVQRSFRILFEGGDEIAFFADTDDEKTKWMEVLKGRIGRVPDHPLWAEMVWQRQEELAKQAATAKSAEQRS